MESDSCCGTHRAQHPKTLKPAGRRVLVFANKIVGGGLARFNGQDAIGAAKKSIAQWGLPCRA